MVNLCESKKVCRRVCEPFDLFTSCFSQNSVCVGKGVLDQDNNNLVSTAEAATLQLEFKYLSYLTDEDGYWRAAEKVRTFLSRSNLMFCEINALIQGHVCD